MKDLDSPLPEEAGLIDQLRAIMLAGLQAQKPPRRRFQHAKGHGLLQAQLQVEPTLSDELAVGIFRPQASYPVVVRFSNGSGNANQADTVPDLRGLALKVQLDSDRVQDFLLVNTPTFFLRNVADYLTFIPLLGAIKAGKVNPADPASVPEEWRQSLAQVGYAFGILQAATSKPVESLLAIDYFSATPYRLGSRAIKFSLRPQNPAQAIKPPASEHFLREGLTQQLQQHEVRFDLLLQLQQDPQKMPIEDPTVLWNEQDSPFRKVATLVIPPQEFNTPEQLVREETTAFSPWNTLDEHAPLGGVNRGRRIYHDLANLRQNH